jgi:hypothetical protein
VDGRPRSFDGLPVLRDHGISGQVLKLAAVAYHGPPVALLRENLSHLKGEISNLIAVRPANPCQFVDIALRVSAAVQRSSYET